MNRIKSIQGWKIIFFILAVVLGNGVTQLSGQILKTGAKTGRTENRYDVGFSNQTIFNKKLKYKNRDYQGAYPLFLNIWFPIKKGNRTQNQFLKYGDFRKRDLPDNLKDVYSRLEREQDRQFVQYNIKESLPNYQAIKYPGASHEKILAIVKKTNTKSRLAPIPKTMNFPVIVYHHGSGGISDENFLMAEYFASRGFIVISAVFQLPQENQPFGLVEAIRNDTTNAQAVLDFGKGLTTSKESFFIGHSWGAQVGWTFLHQKGTVDAFVSLETTIEKKTDLKEISKKWPFVYKTIVTEKKKYQIPIILFGYTEKNLPFPFFERVGKREVLFVSPKIEMSHESYTSAFFLRYFLRDQFPQPDEKLMAQQLKLYRQTLQVIESFLKATAKGKPFPKSKHKKNFSIYVQKN